MCMSNANQLFGMETAEKLLYLTYSLMLECFGKFCVMFGTNSCLEWTTHHLSLNQWTQNTEIVLQERWLNTCLKPCPWTNSPSSRRQLPIDNRLTESGLRWWCDKELLPQLMAFALGHSYPSRLQSSHKKWSCWNQLVAQPEHTCPIEELQVSVLVSVQCVSHLIKTAKAISSFSFPRENRRQIGVKILTHQKSLTAVHCQQTNLVQREILNTSVVTQEGLQAVYLQWTIILRENKLCLILPRDQVLHNKAYNKMSEGGMKNTCTNKSTEWQCNCVENWPITGFHRKRPIVWEVQLYIYNYVVCLSSSFYPFCITWIFDKYFLITNWWCPRLNAQLGLNKQLHIQSPSPVNEFIHFISFIESFAGEVRGSSPIKATWLFHVSTTDNNYLKLSR